MILEWVNTLGPVLISWPIVCLIAILIFRKSLLALADRIQRFKLAGVEFESIKVAVDQVEKRQSIQESEIKAIQIALKGILTKHETGPLTQLSGPEKVLIRYEPDLYRYLHRLDGLGFIQPKNGHGLYDIEKDHKDDERLPYEQRPPFDLKEYVYITDEGKKYLNILNDILKKSGQPR
jgi:hypothetical protein